MTLPTAERRFKGADLIVVCSVLIIAAAVTIVYFVPGNDSTICCNFAQELNITRKLSVVEMQIQIKL